MGMKLPPEEEAKVLAMADRIDGQPVNRPPKMSEKAFMSLVVKMAKARGWFVYHTFDSRRSEAGFPDLLMVRTGLAVRPARLIVAELKVETNKPTPEQLVWLQAFSAAGIPAYVWYPTDLALIESVLEGRS